MVRTSRSRTLTSVSLARLARPSGCGRPAAARRGHSLAGASPYAVPYADGGQDERVPRRGGEASPRRARAFHRHQRGRAAAPRGADGARAVRASPPPARPRGQLRRTIGAGDRRPAGRERPRRPVTDVLVCDTSGLLAARTVADDVAAGAYDLARLTAGDIAACVGVDRAYGDLGIGLADASLVVLAARTATRSLLTLDERHFRAVRPQQGGAFRLLPADE